MDSGHENQDSSLDAVKGGSNSIPIWIYGAAAGGAVLLGATVVATGNWLWRRNKKQITAERNALFKADYVESMTPREEHKKE